MLIAPKSKQTKVSVFPFESWYFVFHSVKTINQDDRFCFLVLKVLDVLYVQRETLIQNVTNENIEFLSEGYFSQLHRKAHTASITFPIMSSSILLPVVLQHIPETLNVYIVTEDPRAPSSKYSCVIRPLALYTCFLSRGEVLQPFLLEYMSEYSEKRKN